MTYVLVQRVRVWQMTTRRRLQAKENVALGRTRTDYSAELPRWQGWLATGVTHSLSQWHSCAIRLSLSSFYLLVCGCYKRDCVMQELGKQLHLGKLCTVL